MDESVTKTVSSTSVQSLVSRLDRLDSTVMRYLEGKKDGSKWAGNGGVEVVEKERMPLDLAVKEAQIKGSILDRITSLEDHIVQLILDNESERASGSQSSSEIEETSSSITTTSGGSTRKGFSQSFSRFRSSSSHPNKQTCVDKFEVGDRRDDEQQQKAKKMEGSLIVGKESGKVNEKPPKKISPNCLHFRLLGC